MKFLKYALIVLMIPLMTSFEAPDLKLPDDLFQKWVFSSQSEGKTFYSSDSNFDKRKPGIEFFEDGRLIVRQNSGWCGTPPITYANLEGSWKKVSSELIRIEHRYWGGTMVAELRLVRLNKGELVVRREHIKTIKN